MIRRVQQRRQRRQAQREAAQWDQRWQVVLGGANPPAYQGKLELPKSAPTHVQAVFQIDADADFDVYAEGASKLAPALGLDMVLIERVPTVDLGCTPIPGAAQTPRFTVVYALTPLGERPWARPELDDQTLEFGIRWGFQRAFQQLELGAPSWAGMRVLRRAAHNRPDVVVETLWRLPHGMPASQLAAHTLGIQEKMEMRWLRIGCRSPGQDHTSGLVSVCYSDNPDLNSGLHPADSEFLNKIEWEHTFRTVGLHGTGGVMPPYRGSQDTEQGLRTNNFGGVPGLLWETVQAARSALSAALNCRYVQLEQTDEAGGFRIICGTPTRWAANLTAQVTRRLRALASMSS